MPRVAGSLGLLCLDDSLRHSVKSLYSRWQSICTKSTYLSLSFIHHHLHMCITTQPGTYKSRWARIQSVITVSTRPESTPHQTGQPCKKHKQTPSKQFLHLISIPLIIFGYVLTTLTLLIESLGDNYTYDGMIESAVHGAPKTGW